ncbi:hypothetical protein C2I06_08690 [Niallia circulans]|nr:hypothetical protein C2I06_08690 [Niallia circulans]
MFFLPLFLKIFITNLFIYSSNIIINYNNIHTYIYIYIYIYIYYILVKFTNIGIRRVLCLS